jgi:CO/xanthine dehydrogenase FAD-binding subunit
MLVSAVFARPLPGERSALRWAWRRHGDFVIGAVGMRMQLTHDARIAQLQAWAGGFDVCPVPLAPALSDMLGERPDPRAFAPLAARACNFEPLSDLRASATYRRELLERLLNECFVQCVAEPT